LNRVSGPHVRVTSSRNRCAAHHSRPHHRVDPAARWRRIGQTEESARHRRRGQVRCLGDVLWGTPGRSGSRATPSKLTEVSHAALVELGCGVRRGAV
jgi:hypothetical protein